MKRKREGKMEKWNDGKMVESKNTNLKGALCVSHRAHRATEDENLPCYTTDCLPCPCRGEQSRYAGLCMGKALEEKTNKFFFSSKTFSHETVSNLVPHSTPPSTLWARATLSRVEGERARGDNIGFLFTSKMHQQRR